MNAHDKQMRAHARRKKRLMFTSAAVALMLWLAWPSRVMIDESCKLNDPRASISAAIWRGWLWKSQLALLVAERDQALARQAHPEVEDEVAGPGATEARMNHLADRDNPQGEAEKERQRAAIQHKRLERIAWLTRCQAVIEERLKK